MKELTITIKKCPKNLMAEDYIGKFHESYVINFNGKDIMQVPPNVRICSLIRWIKEKENLL